MSKIVVYDDDKKALIKRTVAKDATDDELALFLHQADRMGLDVLSKQLVFQKFNSKDGPKVSFITTVDAYRIIAERSGTYAGNDEPVFSGGTADKPEKATATVWKIVAGMRVAFTASVYWSEYCPPSPRDHMWQKMPHVMLGKCAEAAALRKAFPNDLAGAYIREEMDQAGGDVIDVTPKAPMPRVTEHNGNGNTSHGYAWLIADEIVDNKPHATALAKLLRLEELDEMAQRERVTLYRKWRELTEDKKVAAAHAIAGNLPEADPETA